MKLSKEDQLKVDLLMTEEHGAKDHWSKEHPDCYIQGSFSEAYYDLKMDKLVATLVKRVDELEEKVYGEKPKKKVEPAPVSEAPKKKSLFK